MYLFFDTLNLILYQKVNTLEVAMRMKSSLSSVQMLARRQMKQRIDSLANMNRPKRPKNGWIRAIRESLGMSGAQLGQRLGFSRNKISILERKEMDDSITLGELRQLARGLNAELVYMVVPNQAVDDMIQDRAVVVATGRVKATQKSMFLETQQISSQRQQEMINEMANQIKDMGGRVLWSDDVMEQKS